MLLSQFVTPALGCGADWLMIEVAGEPVIGILAIQSDSLYVFDQWCIARGQSGSRGLWQLSNLFVNQAARKRHPVKSIRTNLPPPNNSPLLECLTCNELMMDFQNFGGFVWCVSVVSSDWRVTHYYVVKVTPSVGSLSVLKYIL